jgi:Ca2+-binding RTX toxin-like protein
VSGWTGHGTLIDSASTGDIVSASKKAGYTLTNAVLSSTDGMVLNLSGITTANLAATAAKGSPNLIVDASRFTGTTVLTALGTGTVILLGGSGHGGQLTATGSGNDILIGGPGSDTLTDSSSGRGILIGGAGADRITGNGNDILVSGTTAYDSNTSAHIAALDAILAEWSSTDSYAVRIKKIMQGVGTAGTDALNAKTVHSDGVANTVSDGSGTTQNNWFIVSSLDKVTKKANETETVIN